MPDPLQGLTTSNASPIGTHVYLQHSKGRFHNFRPHLPPYATHHNKAYIKLAFLKKTGQKIVATLVGKMVQISQTSLNILAPIPIKDTNPYHPCI